MCAVAQKGLERDEGRTEFWACLVELPSLAAQLQFNVINEVTNN